MATYEVLVSALKPQTVEADTPEEAKEKARQEIEFDESELIANSPIKRSP